jgi:hypothetical protein
MFENNLQKSVPPSLLVVLLFGTAGSGAPDFVGNNGVNWDTSGSVTATASSSHSTRIPLLCINGVGLDAATGLKHDSLPTTGFISRHDTDSAPNMPHEGCVNGKHWIEFAFDKIYTLGELWIWNYNEVNYAPRGWKDVSIQYSTVGGPDPNDWKTLGGAGATHQIAMATGADNYEHGSNEYDFEGAKAKYVVITCHVGWGTHTSQSMGLHEVRFHKAEVIEGSVLFLR